MLMRLLVTVYCTSFLRKYKDRSSRRSCGKVEKPGEPRIRHGLTLSIGWLGREEIEEKLPAGSKDPHNSY
jgi:hypothetical protein